MEETEQKYHKIQIQVIQQAEEKEYLSQEEVEEFMREAYS